MNRNKLENIKMITISIMNLKMIKMSIMNLKMITISIINVKLITMSIMNIINVGVLNKFSQIRNNSQNIYQLKIVKNTNSTIHIF